MDAKDIPRAEDNDPHRCQDVNDQGQCHNLAIKLSGEDNKEVWTKMCICHGGAFERANWFKKNKKMYQLGQWQAKLERQLEQPEIKGLRNEVGVLRMLLDERFQSIKDNNDLLINSPRISELIMKIEKVVKSCHSLEKSMGQVLDKSSILQFASEVVSIISQHISGDLLDKIANEITMSVARSSSPEEL